MSGEPPTPGIYMNGERIDNFPKEDDNPPPENAPLSPVSSASSQSSGFSPPAPVQNPPAAPREYVPGVYMNGERIDGFLLEDDDLLPENAPVSPVSFQSSASAPPQSSVSSQSSAPAPPQSSVSSSSSAQNPQTPREYVPGVYMNGERIDNIPLIRKKPKRKRRRRLRVPLLLPVPVPTTSAEILWNLVLPYLAQRPPQQ